MKTKILMSILAIGLSVALIAGATMAWFTDETEVEPAQFTAGTVVVDADGPATTPAPGKSFENVNPGDCGKVEWTIINKGTKAAEFRVKLSELWEDELSTENFFYAPAPDSDWVIYEEDGEIWLYYIGGSVAGTFGLEEGEDPASVKLELIVAFDGELTDNDYQGKEFTLSGDVYAIQASNGAPAAEWGDAWEAVTGDNYEPAGLAAEYLAYIQETPCWEGGGEEPEEPEPDEYNVEANIVVAGGGSVSGTGWFEEGDAVELVAVEEDGFVFTGWSGYEGLPDAVVDDNVLTFTMPAYAVTVTANFEEEAPQPDVINFDYKDLRVSAENRGSGTNKYTRVTITGKVRNYTVNGIQADVTKTIEGYVDISGYQSYSGTTSSYIHNGWSNFSITYDISGGHYVSSINGQHSKVRIEIDGVVKP